MKKNIKKLMLMTGFVLVGFTMLAQPPAGPPPPPSGGHGQTGNQPGGGAPLGSGLAILLSLGAAYGGKKIYDMRKKLDE